MTLPRATRATAVLLLAAGLAACAQPPAPAAAPPADGPGPRADLPDDGSGLVLRAEHVGGFTTPEGQAARLPLVSVYADGRVVAGGPEAAIHPGFAWPNVQVRQVPRSRVEQLVDRAMAAGVTDSSDLGAPPLADAPSTRFTLVTADETYVREAYALAEAVGQEGLTDGQEAARAELSALLDELTGVAQPGDGSPRSYDPVAVAAVVTPWTAPEEDVAQGLVPEPLPWPGPPLPGEPIGPGTSCVLATGAQAAAVRTAAAGATVLTPWSTPDGARWSVAFRPLLPDESGCADLTD